MLLRQHRFSALGECVLNWPSQGGPLRAVFSGSSSDLTATFVRDNRSPSPDAHTHVDRVTNNDTAIILVAEGAARRDVHNLADASRMDLIVTPGASTRTDQVAAAPVCRHRT